VRETKNLPSGAGKNMEDTKIARAPAAAGTEPGKNVNKKD